MKAAEKSPLKARLKRDMGHLFSASCMRGNMPVPGVKSETIYALIELRWLKRWKLEMIIRDTAIASE